MDVSVREGDILGNTYRVERVIGAGGMAVVVSAIHLQENERFAVKIVYRKAARSREVLKRFEREKRAVMHLRSEHVTRLIDAGVFKDSPYMVMELLKGQDLSDILKAEGSLHLEDVAEYLLQACEAIAEAHARGIVHRDLKPGNLFLTRRPDGSPCIKVLDFGIAKLNDPHQHTEESSLTGTTAVFGSPFYMSPEQMVSSRSVTAASDIWSLGVILHELLTGELPFAEKSVEKVCSRVLNGTPNPLRQVRPEYPAELEQIILRCLQRRPEQRFANVTDFAIALARFAPPHALISLRYITAVLPPAQVDVSSLPKVPQPRPSFVSIHDPSDVESPTIYMPQKGDKRLHKRPIAMVAFVLVVFAAGLGTGLYFRQAPPAPPAPSAALAPSAPPSAEPPAAAEDPDAEVDPLSQIPVEMDLDEASPQRRRVPTDAGVRRQPKPDADIDLTKLAETYESTLEGTPSATATAVRSAAPPVRSATPSPKSPSGPASTAVPTSDSTAASERPSSPIGE